MAIIPDAQVPGVYHRRVGQFLVTALHDGYQDVSMATVLGISPAEAEAMLGAARRPVPRRTTVNAFLVRDRGRTILVDAGCGTRGAATVGQLMPNLAAAGVDTADIDLVLMTHLHPDHFGGLTDAAGHAVFPRAELLLHEAEYAYWHDDDAMMRMTDPARRTIFFINARKALAPYAGRLRTITAGEVLSGITAVALPGHTPGHTGYRIASEGRSLLIWGDIVHVQELQVQRPEVTMLVDVDPPAAIRTRRQLLAEMADRGEAVAGMHLHFPGLAHLAHGPGGIHLLPDAWSTDLAGDAPSDPSGLRHAVG
jgi:glyoxylase-like metal-dependent hydrolase (beta-lactamase superfamily II)